MRIARKGLFKWKAFVCEKGWRFRIASEFFANERFLVCKKGGFGGLFIKLLIMETFWVVKKADFSAHARPLGEEKLLLTKKVGFFSSCKADQ